MCVLRGAQITRCTSFPKVFWRLMKSEWQFAGGEQEDERGYWMAEAGGV